MGTDSLVLYALIITCELGFWLILLLGLACRYLFRLESASRALLYALPFVDAMLLVATALDLRAGQTATFAHGLAAAYVGFTVAFGGLAVTWADAHFAHRFANGPAPQKAPGRGWAAVRYDLALWLRCVLACAITVALVEALARIAAPASAADALLAWHRHAFGCVVLWFVFGPLWALATAWRKGAGA